MSERKLIIGLDGYALPLDAATQTFAFLAKKGVGKTYNSGVIAEELLKAGVPVCVVDPTGVHWGLRLDPSGEPGGFPIIVFGGEHADLPLHEDQGEAVAHFVVESRRAVILDLSLFRKGEMHRFMIAFAETLYRINREPLHILLDEADLFAPQRPFGEESRLLGAIDDIVRRGRVRGLGMTMITQRPAVLNKNVLSQIEALFCLRIIAAIDIKAIGTWVEEHGTPEQWKELRDSLPRLPVGEGWLWSPAWLDEFRPIKFRRKETFDSSKTPKVGETVVLPKQLTPVDLDLLREQFSAAIEEKAANDPKALKKRIAELEAAIDTEAFRQLHEEATGLRTRIRLLEQSVDNLRAAAYSDGQAIGKAVGFDEGVEAMNAVLLDVIKTALEEAERQRQQLAPPKQVGAPATLPAVAVQEPARAEQMPKDDKAAQNGKETPKPGDTVDPKWIIIVRVLRGFQVARIGNAAPKVQVAWIGEFSPTSSTFNIMLADMKRAGLIVSNGGDLMLTDAGNRLADQYQPFDISKAAMLAEIGRRMSKTRFAIVNCVLEGEFTREQIAERVKVSKTSSSFGIDLADLRKKGFVDYQGGKVVAGSLLSFTRVMK